MAFHIKPDQVAAGRRLALLEVLRRQPGLSFRGVLKASGLAGGTCAHHLTILERYGLAWSIGHRQRRRTFAGPRPADDVALYLARCAGMDAAMAALLAFVQTNPGCIQKTIIQAFASQRPDSTVQHQLGRLERDGFLTRTASGRCWRHFATQPPAGLRSLASGDEVVQSLVRTYDSILPAAVVRSQEAEA